MTLGERIQSKRSALGLSQERLAELVGVSRQAVSKWELSDALPDTDKLIPLARALRITVDELLGNIQEEPYLDVGHELNSETHKKPGWFVTHWYYIGLVPVIWGVWQLLWLLVMIFSMAGFMVGGTQIITSSGAIPIG